MSAAHFSIPNLQQ